MSGGLVGSGQQMRTSALDTMTRYSSLDAKLKTEGAAIKQQAEIAEKQQNTGMGAAAGMASGALIGASLTAWSGPGAVVGAAVGALVGGIAGSLF